MPRAGLNRAEGVTVTAVPAGSTVLIQVPDTVPGQPTPRIITVADLISSGGGTVLDGNSLVFTDSDSDLATDDAFLAVNTTTGTVSVTSVLNTNNALDINTGNVNIDDGNILFTNKANTLSLKVASAGAGKSGTATLVSGTVTVANTAVTANSKIITVRMGVNASTALGELTIGTITANTSFVINALNVTNAAVVTGDLSTVWYWIVEQS